MGTVQEVLLNYGVTASEEELAKVVDEALKAAGFCVPYADPRTARDADVVKLLEQGGLISIIELSACAIRCSRARSNMRSCARRA